ncbi:MAG: S41 family peptidase [Armatimonadetes bacterium]|nr:S41 family peptidase [Armatimonadota bacterium]MCX7967682.1 S41 family peptidase [Armatimonadota bacterium]MDW8142675.1 S41 family peptidase [Armatimonadota bacterium]
MNISNLKTEATYMEQQSLQVSQKIKGVFSIAIALLVALSFAAGYQVGNRRSDQPQLQVSLGPGLVPPIQEKPIVQQPSQPSLRPVERLAEVYLRLQQYFYAPNKLEENQLTYGAISGLLRATGDQYTRYLKPEDLEQFTTRSHGEYEGIGAELTLAVDPTTGEERITIMSVFPEQPADKAGLRPLDRILKIDGKPTDKMTLDQAVSMIRGPRGTTVTLTIQRDGIPEPFDVTLTRQRIQIPVLQKRMLDDKVGYIRLLEFNEKTASELSRALDELKGKGAQALILDLRGNPGGLLDAAVEVASLFVPKGPIVTVKSRTEGEQVFEAIPSLYKGWKGPMVVLVDNRSASASEIVAGALKDHKVAEVLGEKTFGKASVQTVVTLRGGGALIVTTGSYLTPSGYDIHANKGLEPDRKLEPTPEEQKHNSQLAATWLERGKQHLQAKELEDALICFGRARQLDRTNKEASKLFNETVAQLVEQERNRTKDAQLEQVQQMLLQKLNQQKPMQAEAKASAKP